MRHTHMDTGCRVLTYAFVIMRIHISSKMALTDDHVNGGVVEI